MKILQNWQGVYIHIEGQEFKAGDDVNGNNVMEGDANNRSNVCTSCTNDDNGHVLMSIGYYCMQQYSQIRDEIGGSGGHTLMV